MAKKDKKKSGKDKDADAASDAPMTAGPDARAENSGKNGPGKNGSGGHRGDRAGAGTPDPADLVVPTWDDLVADPIPHAEAAPAPSVVAGSPLAAAGAATPPVPPPVSPPAPPRPAPSPSPTPAAAGSGSWSSDDVADALLVPLRVARQVLPARRTPVFLGVAALAVVGAIDWPIAVGAGLGWEALRRWGPGDRTSGTARPGR